MHVSKHSPVQSARLGNHRRGFGLRHVSACAFMLLGSFSLSVAFRFLRPFLRFQVPFRQGCVGQNRLNLNANEGKAFRPPYPTLPPTSLPFRVTEGSRTQHTCVLVPFLLFLLLATRAVQDKSPAR